MALQIEEREFDGVIVLELAGRATMGEESNQLRHKIKAVLANGSTRLVIDMGSVTYVDSATTGTLLAGHTSARGQGASMKLANIPRQFREVLTLTRLLPVFDIYPSVQDAIRSFGR